MKLYRVVPNIFSTENRLDAGKLHVEAIYYKMGYTSFNGKQVMHKYNNVFEKQESIKEGKYFFLFPEDAVKEGYYLLTRAHNLANVSTFFILEYDFPEDIIFKHFGFGDYTFVNGMKKFLLETYIEKTDFITNPNDILSPNQVCSEARSQVLIDMLSETLKASMENRSQDWIWYYEYCQRMWLNFDNIVDDPIQIAQIIKESSLYFPQSGELIKSSYLTGHIIMINILDAMQQCNNWDDASEYFRMFGIQYDNSKEQEEFKQELIRLSGYNNSGEKNKEKVMALLRKKYY